MHFPYHTSVNTYCIYMFISAIVVFIWLEYSFGYNLSTLTYTVVDVAVILLYAETTSHVL